MAETKQFRAIVRGRVQGVYFRATTAEEARRLGLAGYARNLPDGSVEVVARGAEEALRDLVAFLHRGPIPARVSGVEVDWDDSSPAPDPFTVKH
ncbi:MAG: acylphosphatase [Candidatus Eisenbacteria bacterium]|nr:acylphosphatase [Candidatus Latescibacterota bacterium]MBD3301907.1 acylphosphatase [Candidatus Eisenbacteria bacterium]